MDGRRYKVFRRPATESGIWYVHFKRERRRYLRSLETSTKSEAEKRVKLLVRRIRSQKWEQAETPTVTKLATVGQVIETYLAKAAQEIKPQTAKNNTGQFRNVIRLARRLTRNENDKVDALPTSILTARLIREFKDNLVGGYLDGKEGEAAEHARRRAWASGNSVLLQARSVFSPRMLRAYRDASIQLPPLAEFLKEPGFKRLRTEYTPPPDEIVANTFAATEDLRETDPNLFKAFWLATGCGLRKGEIVRMRWEWFVPQNGAVWIQTNILGKGGEIIRVPVIPDAWAKLEPLRKESGPVLEGTKTESGETVFRRIGEWMKGLGWKTEKKIHEMRAYIACKIAETYGITTASAFLRHKDVRVTQRSYSRYFQLKGISVNLVTPAGGLAASPKT